MAERGLSVGCTTRWTWPDEAGAQRLAISRAGTNCRYHFSQPAAAHRGDRLRCPYGDRQRVACALKRRPVHFGLQSRKVHSQRRTASNAACQREVFTRVPLPQFMPAHCGREHRDALQGRELILNSVGHTKPSFLDVHTFVVFAVAIWLAGFQKANQCMAIDQK